MRYKTYIILFNKETIFYLLTKNFCVKCQCILLLLRKDTIRKSEENSYTSDLGETFSSLTFLGNISELYNITMVLYANQQIDSCVFSL